MVRTLVFRTSGPSLGFGWGLYVVFLGKVLNSPSVPLYPGVLMDTRQFNAGGGGGAAKSYLPNQRGSRNTPSFVMLLTLEMAT